MITEETINALKHLLPIIFRGWQLHEQSFNKETGWYDRDDISCMIEAAGGDEDVGHLLYLFGHWSNDIQCIAKSRFEIEVPKL